MKKKIITAGIATTLLLSPIVSFADSSTPVKSNDFTQHNFNNIENQPTVLFSETIQYDENGQVIDRQTKGTENPIPNKERVIINDGSFNWKYSNTKNSSNRVNKDSYNVGLILVGGLSSFLPTAPLQSTAIVVSGGLAYFYQPAVTYYTSDVYTDIDAYNRYVKTVTVSKNANGTKLYSDTKVMKYLK